MNDTTAAAVTSRADVPTVEHVLGSHLPRFATREELTVAWSRTGGPTGPP